MRTSLIAALLLFSFSGFGFTTPAPERIRPSQAAEYVNRTVTLEMEVKSAASIRRGCYLNSEKNQQNSHNVSVWIDTDGREKLLKEKDIRDPAEYFNGKTIRATGKILLENGRPQMRISDAGIGIIDKE